MVGVAGRKQRLQFHPRHAPERHVFDALPAFVLHDVALILEGRCERGAVEQKSHARAFQPQRQFQLARRQGLEIVGAVSGGRTVACRGAGLAQILEVGVLGDLLGPLEHHVFEEVGEAGLARGFVL